MIAGVTEAADRSFREHSRDEQSREHSRDAQSDVIADVIVVGGGGAGLSAAIAARGANAQTVLLEKNPALGGTTRLSMGAITASGTSWQRRKGIEDTPDEHFEDMEKFLGHMAGRDNLELRRLYVDNAADALEWLKSIGIGIYGPLPEPPHRKPRMHTMLPNARAFDYFLGREARRVGVDIRLNARATQLMREDGRITGVSAIVDDAPVRFLARRGVILASGDISAAEDFRKRYRPDAVEVAAMNPRSTGDGQRMGLAVGGSMRNGDLMLGPSLYFKAPAKENVMRRLPPYRVLTGALQFALERLPPGMLRSSITSVITSSMPLEPSVFKAGSVLVNMHGKRFTDETTEPAADVARQPGKCAWLVMDDKLARRLNAWPYFMSSAPGAFYAYFKDYRRTRKDLYRTGATIQELAAQMQVPAAALIRSIEEHNRSLPGLVNHSADEERSPLTSRPFHALGPVQSWVMVADAGLAIDAQLRVIDRAGKPVPGLWAAGSAGQGGIILAGHGHHIGWAVTSGRLAGRAAASAKRAEERAARLS